MAYLTRRGSLRRPADYVEAPDDGATLVRVERPFRCADCGGVDTLREGPPVPPPHFGPDGRRRWLRVCNACNAHWDEEVVRYHASPDDRLHIDGGDHDGRDVALRLDMPVSSRQGAPTHRTVLESIAESELVERIDEARRAFGESHEFFKGPYPRVPFRAGWARRARFHPVTIGYVPMDPGAPTSDSILSYFERLSVEQACFDAWAEGAEATREWRAMVERGDGSQERVDELFEVLGAERGPMFAELGRLIARWAAESGWQVR
jgi:hypothetical protein